MSTVTGYIGRDHYKTVVSNTTNQLIADEPTSVGGKDEGLAPSEILGASLASCTCITVRMYADRKEWSLDEVIVTVNINRDIKANTTKITKEIQLIGDLDEEQITRLKKISESCPIHKMLINPIEIESI